MTEKTLKVVVGVVGVLVVLYVVTAMTGRGPGPASGGDGRALVAALDAAGRPDLEAARIIGPADSIELARGPDGWTVNGRPADEAAVRRLTDALAAARVSHLASDNPENHARLGVDEAEGWRLEVRHAGGRTQTFVVGQSGPSHPSAYVRLDGGTETYVVRGDLGQAARRGLADWRDRTIVRVDTAAVHEVTVSRDGESYTLVRGAEGWTLDGGPAAANVVRDLVAELARLEAQGYADVGDDAAAALAAVAAEPAREVAARDAEGRVLAHVRMAETDESWTLRVLAEGPGAPQPDVVFELASWRADRLAPERERAAQ